MFSSDVAAWNDGVEAAGTLLDVELTLWFLSGEGTYITNISVTKRVTDKRKLTLLLRPTCRSLFLAILIRIISSAFEDSRAVGSVAPGLAGCSAPVLCRPEVSCAF